MKKYVSLLNLMLRRRGKKATFKSTTSSGIAKQSIKLSQNLRPVTYVPSPTMFANFAMSALMK